MHDSTNLLIESRRPPEDPASHESAVEPVGPLGADEVRDVAAAVARSVADGHLSITIDLSRVTDLDAVGLAFLKRVRRRLEARGGRLVIRGASAGVAHMLDLCGIEHRQPAGRHRSRLSRALRPTTPARSGR